MPLKGAQGGGGSGKAGAGDVRAGGAFYEIFGKDNLTKVLDKIQARVKVFTEFMKKTGTTLLLGGGALAAGPLALFVGGANRLAQIGQLAREFEAPIQVMARLQYAAEQAGVSIQDVANDTTGRFRDLLKNAPVVNPEEVRQATAAQRDFKNTIISLQLAMTPLLGTVAPLVKQFALFARENANLVRVIGVAGVGLFALGLAFKGVGLAAAVVVAGFKLVAAAVALLLSPIGLVTAALVGLGALWLTQTEAGRQAATSLSAAFKTMGAAFGETWSGIIDAIKAGDLELAFTVLSAGVKAIFFTMIAALAKSFADFLRDTHRKIVAVAGIVGAVKGGGVGGRFGALGAIVGAGAGGAAAGFGADAALEALEGGLEAAAGRFDARADAAGADLKAARGRAAVARAAVEDGAEADRRRFADEMAKRVAKPFEAVKGAFLTPFAKQQFAFGDGVKQQTELQKQLNAMVAELPEKIGEAVLAGIVAR